jgi:hypothetical protein
VEDGHPTPFYTLLEFGRLGRQHEYSTELSRLTFGVMPDGSIDYSTVIRDGTIMLSIDSMHRAYSDLVRRAVELAQDILQGFDIKQFGLTTQNVQGNVIVEDLQNTSDGFCFLDAKGNVKLQNVGSAFFSYLNGGKFVSEIFHGISVQSVSYTTVSRSLRA